MKTTKAGLALLVSFSLAACSGGTSDTTSAGTGGTGTGTGTTPAVSRIFDVSLPDDLSSLPMSAQDTLNEFDSRNQMAVATSRTLSSSRILQKTGST